MEWRDCRYYSMTFHNRPYHTEMSMCRYQSSVSSQGRSLCGIWYVLMLSGHVKFAYAMLLNWLHCAKPMLKLVGPAQSVFPKKTTNTVFEPVINWKDGIIFVILVNVLRFSSCWYILWHESCMFHWLLVLMSLLYLIFRMSCVANITPQGSFCICALPMTLAGRIHKMIPELVILF